jgi:hypothetical protein
MRDAATETAATDAGKAATTATMETTTAAAAAMAAASTAAMAAEGHRAGRHRCCKGHGHRTCDKLFPHRNLLQ